MERLRVLIACEYSGIVREAFKAKGHDAWSCDLLDTEIPGQHIKGDVLEILNDGWDMMIGFPPCTYLATSANAYFLANPERWEKRLKAMLFVWKLWKANVEKIALENPKSVISSWLRKPDQIIHPYYFGDPIPKTTCLWLKNLPVLKYSLKDDMFQKSTAVDPEYVLYNSKKTKSGKSRYSKFGKLGAGHGKERSIFYSGIANAMAAQWS